MAVTAEITGLRYGGRVPQSYKKLLKLRGVGPKIAHLLRSVSFGMDDTGIVVDTHVHRIATMLGWVPGGNTATPETTRVALETWVPRGEWTAFTLSVVWFGQATQRVNFEQDFYRFAKEQQQGGDSEEEASSVMSTARNIVVRLKQGQALTCPWDNSARLGSGNSS